MYLSTQRGFWLEENKSLWIKIHQLSRVNKSPLVNNNLNFRLSRDKVVHRETAANVSASLCKKNNILAVIFELGGMTKHF